MAMLASPMVMVRRVLASSSGCPWRDVKRTLRGEGVAVVADASDDFALFRLGVGVNGERWAIDRACDGGDNRFGSRCVRRGFDGVLNKSDL